MSLPTAIVATLALTTPDLCTEARELAEEIARARDNQVPIVEILEIVHDNPLWLQMTAVIYTSPNVPPVAIGAMTEAACRG